MLHWNSRTVVRIPIRCFVSLFGHMGGNAEEMSLLHTVTTAYLSELQAKLNFL